MNLWEMHTFGFMQLPEPDLWDMHVQARPHPKVPFCFRSIIDSAARPVYSQRALGRDGRLKRYYQCTLPHAALTGRPRTQMARDLWDMHTFSSLQLQPALNV